jgi:dihydroorotate dehydrogenase
VTIGLLAAQARLPWGNSVFRLMASARPSEAVRTEFVGLKFPSPVGLGAGIDVDGSAALLMQELGLGFLELGPLGVTPRQASSMTNPRRVQRMHGLVTSAARGGPAVAGVVEKVSSLTVPVGIQLRTDRMVETIESVSTHVDFITLATAAGDSRAVLREARAASDRPLLARVFAGWDRDRIHRVVDNVQATGIDGIVVVAGADYPGLAEGEMVWRGALPSALSLIGDLGDKVPVALAGGVLTPADAEAALTSGARLLFLSDGLVFAGPGLPKRINRYLAYADHTVHRENGQVNGQVHLGNGQAARPSLPEESTRSDDPPGLPDSLEKRERVGIALLAGTALATLLSGVAYLVLAATVTLLPHETAYLGMSVSRLCRIDHCRLVDFIAHGRASYASALIATGVMFAWLSIGPLRRREPWAWWALLLGGLALWASFLSFLAYNYLDRWHAAWVCATGIVWVGGLFLTRPDFKEVGGLLAAFRRPAVDAWLWSPAGRGRLMIGMFASGLVTAGLLILFIASSDVFVPQDLAFIHLSPDGLRAINDRLIPVMAHDRAGFGGGQLALGILFGATAWSGIRANARGAWWALGLAGACLMVPAFAAHMAVGYTSVVHLSPIYSGAVLLTIALITLRKTMSSGSYEAREMPDV